jgi:hypothetical protein
MTTAARLYASLLNRQMNLNRNYALLSQTRPLSAVQIFLIRERTSADGEPEPDDRIVRSFSVRHDASMYADSVNKKQKELDEHLGRRQQHAL